MNLAEGEPAWLLKDKPCFTMLLALFGSVSKHVVDQSLFYVEFNSAFFHFYWTCVIHFEELPGKVTLCKTNK